MDSNLNLKEAEKSNRLGKKNVEEEEQQCRAES